MPQTSLETDKMSHLPGYTLRPAQKADIPALSNLLYTSKLALTINRLLFKTGQTRLSSAKTTPPLSRPSALGPSTTESLTVVHDKSDQIVAHLALTRRKPEPEHEQES